MWKQGRSGTELQSHNPWIANNLAMIFLLPADQRNDFYGRLNHDKHSICPWNQLYSGHGLVSRVQHNPVKLLRQDPPPLSLFFFYFFDSPYFHDSSLYIYFFSSELSILLCESFSKRTRKLWKLKVFKKKFLNLTICKEFPIFWNSG